MAARRYAAEKAASFLFELPGDGDVNDAESSEANDCDAEVNRVGDNDGDCVQGDVTQPYVTGGGRDSDGDCPRGRHSAQNMTRGGHVEGRGRECVCVRGGRGGSW